MQSADVVIYNTGEIELKIPLNENDIWLSANDIASIFGVNRPAIVKHIGNIYKTDELSKNTTCSILEQLGTQKSPSKSSTPHTTDFSSSMPKNSTT